MAENSGVLFGKQKVLLFRKASADDTSVDATKLVFQTDHTFTINRDVDRIQTKDGVIVKVGGLEAEVPIEALQSKNDPTAKMLEDSVLNGEKLEMWEVTVDEDLKNEEGKYPAIYVQGYLDSWEIGANVEDESTVSSTFTVEKVPQRGFTALTEGQEEAIQYAFKEAVASVPEV